jgi:hypothetical protein
MHDDDSYTPYRTRQAEKDKAYRDAYDAWMASLTPEERSRLGTMGLNKPHVDGAAAGFSEHDAAEDARTESMLHDENEDGDYCDFDNLDAHQVCPAGSRQLAPQEEPPSPSPAATAIANAPSTDATEEAVESKHDIVRALIGELVIQSNARLTIDCLALISGLLYEGETLTKIAKKHGVTRAAVSKRCVDLTSALSLKPSRALRSLAARSHYRDARLRSLLETS